MFSCYRAARLTIDRLERPLTRLERVRLWGHLFICRHCRAHDWQIRGLGRLIELKRTAADTPGLPIDARNRIRAAMSDHFPRP